jgi:hypothetical protein
MFMQDGPTTFATWNTCVIYLLSRNVFNKNWGSVKFKRERDFISVERLWK